MKIFQANPNLFKIRYFTSRLKYVSLLLVTLNFHKMPCLSEIVSGYYNIGNVYEDLPRKSKFV
jgi:hypothetical protein